MHWARLAGNLSVFTPLVSSLLLLAVVPTAADADTTTASPSGYHHQHPTPDLASVALPEVSLAGLGTGIGMATSSAAAGVARSAPLVFPAPARHTATVIFAHGLGDTGHGWASAVENWRRRQRLDEVKFVLPHAPMIPITVNGGMRMPGWFDIKTFAGSTELLRRHEDRDGILKSQEYFQSLIQSEIDAGIPADRVVLGGFSQGGAMSLFSGLTFRHKLAGIVALSCWLPLSTQFAEHVPDDAPNKATKVFMGHGDEDPLVEPRLAKQSAELLKGMGYDVTLKTYEGMGHSACLEELDEVEAFLRDRLPPLGKN